MKISDLWKSYDFYTSELTKSCRQLAFVCGAMCLFFKAPTFLQFPRPVLFALGFLIIYFITDIFQYLWASLRIKCWTEEQEKNAIKKAKSDGTNIHEALDKYPAKNPKSRDKPIFFVFILKIVFLLIAFIFLGIHILFSLVI